jgi:cytochrome c2
MVQMIPKDRVKQIKSMRRRSLMLSAAQLGLKDQEIADIIAYMKEWELKK